MSSETRNHLFALAVANEGNSQLFDAFLEEFTQVVHGHTFFTGELKSSASKVQSLIDLWLKTAKGILYKRIVDFQEDFEMCLHVVKNLPKKIDKFWQRKLRPWYNYARNLVAQKSSLALCLTKTGVVEIEQAFLVHKPSTFASVVSTSLGKNPNVRAAMGIDESIDFDVALTEVTVEFYARIESDPYGSYDKIKKIQEAIPPEKSCDKTKGIRVAFEQQMKKKFGK